eukprot:1219946-Rhodomonas_salina.5
MPMIFSMTCGPAPFSFGAQRAGVIFCGQDNTAVFSGQHPQASYLDRMNSYLVGKLGGSTSSDPAPTDDGTQSSVLLLSEVKAHNTM